MKKFSLILLVLVAIPFGMQAQSEVDEHDFLILSDSSEVILNDVPNNKKSGNKTHVHWNAGMNFGYSPNNYTSSGLYVNPNVTYQPVDRLSLNVGLGFSYTTLHPMGEMEQLYGSSVPVTGLFISAQGAYQLTPKLTVSGAAYHEKNDVPNLNKKNLPNGAVEPDLDRTGVIMGFTYNITPSMTIGIQVGFQEGPSRYSPYGIGSPYSNGYGYPQGFGNPNGWW